MRDQEWSAEEDLPRAQRHFTILMAARLALAVAGLVIALGLETVGGNVTVEEWQGFYGAVAMAFIATLVYRPFAGRVRRMGPFAMANLGLDLALVSALVVFSGGSDSVFTFLYIVVPVYAAVLLPGRGAVTCAMLAGLAYAGVLVAERNEWFGLAASHSEAVLATRWLVHTGALVLVAALAGFLVAELERAGEALQRRTSDLAALRTLHERTVESLMSGLLTTDRDGRITSFNREAERITGVSRAEACGLAAEELLPGVDGLPLDVGDVGGARARIPFEGPEGRRLHLGVGSYVLRDSEGATDGRVIIFQDVSHVVQMEQELRRSERLAAVGELSASIAHEIRNPLAAISGSIQMLEGGKAGDPARLMNIVLREVDRLNHLITDFLEYARPSPAERETVALAPIIEDVAGIVGMSHEGHIEVSVAVEPALTAYADPRKLRQIIWNLLLNASEAMGEGGHLQIHARASAAQGANPGGRFDPEGSPPDASEGDGVALEGLQKPAWAEIAVMDDGSGIDPALAERIFDPFFTTKAGGSGLGLPTVHRIVEEHGGSIRLENGASPGDPAPEGVSWSTVVRVTLPMPGGGA